MESRIFNCLLDLGCCKYCSLRYLQDRNIDFDNIESYIKKYNLSHIRKTALEPAAKQLKPNPCVVCLGLLQDYVMDNVMSKILLSEVQKYDTKVFTCSISIPPASIIREHAIRLHLEKEFPKFYTDGVQEIALNRAWKLIIKDKLSKKLNMAFENSDVCNFSINIVTDYSENREELTIVKKFLTEIPKNGEIYSRKSIVQILSMCKPEQFQKFVRIPLKIPSTYLTCKQIECRHNSIFLAGRYCKYSRELSQSPWIIDGVRTMETSVEEIIFEQISLVLGVLLSNLKFSASGREDCDVRCLGRGRPFYIEILDPTKTIFSFDKFRELEWMINKSNLIQVRDMQSVPRCELSKIKEGEQLKTKDYLALCLTKQPISQKQIDKINSCGEITLDQKTPIRVLHRRPIAIRKRKIFRMEAKLVPDRSDLFELLLVTEAGTYVKEFVHGDFGRTKPSMGDMIGAEVDVIALDVTAINLDWPKEVQYIKKEEI